MGNKYLGLKETEMRIGNLVYDDDGNIVKVERINSDKIHEFTLVSKIDDGIIYPSNVYKIPLTHEMLLKSEFEYENHGIFGCFYSEQFHQGLEIIVSANGFEHYYYSKITHLEYVHEWQNLHFALHGKELEIKI